MPDVEQPTIAPEALSVFQSDLPIGAKLERARTELLDLSARNRLLSIPRSAKSAKVIEVIDERSDEVFRLLVRENRAMSFVAGRASRSAEEAEGEEADEIDDLAQPEDDSVDARGVANRHADTKLQTRLTSKGLQKRLLDLYYDARTLEEEQGVNILYLALGMLKWIDPNNKELSRYAPLVLVPVTLERSTAAERFKLRWRSEDASPNISLQAYLDRVHQITLPVFEPNEEFDPVAYYAEVADAVSSKPGWQVLADDIVLGFFSFAKFLMYRDLDPAVWPEGAKLSDQRIVRALMADGFPSGEPLISEDEPIDPHIPPEEMLHIVDSDGSQTLAVHEVRKGRDLVIQGPPGTGKSQTIANVIAAAVADGRSVLFVAEKMAALEVVKRRLDGAGVGDVCLELHSNKANKRLVLEELRRTWELGSPRGDLGGSLITRLTEARDDLNGHVDRLHSPDPVSGLTPYQITGQLVRLRQEGQSPVEFRLEGSEDWSADAFADRERLVRELVERIADIGRPAEHPWRGVGLRMILPPDAERLMVRIGEVADHVTRAAEAQAEVAAALELEAPATFAAFAAVEALATRVAAAPPLDPAALASAAWDERAADIDAVVAAGREHSELTQALRSAVASDGWTSDVAGTTETLSELPGAFNEAAFARATALAELMPRLFQERDRLARQLGVDAAADTLQTIERLARTGERVGAAPALDPDAFSSAIWDRGVDEAADLTEAVGELHRRRAELQGKLGDAAWTTDLTTTREAVARSGGSMLRFLSGDWRRANKQLKPLLADGTTDHDEIVRRLDTLTAGKAAAAKVDAGDALGRQAFGADWRKDKSDVAALASLTEWMRSLKGLGPEPRLIAARLQDRSAAGERAARLLSLLSEARPLLQQLQRDLGSAADAYFADDLSVEGAPLGAAAARIATLAAADAHCRSVMSAVPNSAADRLGLLRVISRHQVLTATIEGSADLGAQAFAADWRSASSDWAALREAAEWLRANGDIRYLAARVSDRRELPKRAEAARALGSAASAELTGLWNALAFDAATQFGAADPSEVPHADICSRLADWRANDEALFKWASYRDRSLRAREQGMGTLVDRIEDGRIAGDKAVPSFEMAYYEAMLAKAAAAEPALARFDGHLHSRRVGEFRELDLQRIAAARLEVVRAHHRRIPQAGGGAGPLGILRSEVARKRGHMPIRRLMERAGPAIQAIKPVFMMSPLSVAQFLTPGRIEFDLLVMDEASQIQPVDALGAIARARQVVVVGDERQLPPTRFFSKMTSGEGTDDEDDGAQVSDVESVLGLFTARGLPQRMLRWHYRSRHQSLIAVSNSEFYQNKLYIVPSPFTAEAGMGLRFHHLPDGVFDSGGTGTNVAEAKAVAEAVMRHAKEHPNLSLGVAAFSVRQRRAIQDELERLRRLNPDAEVFFQAHPTEPFFVKNLENVQGDERDVIFISVGYGRNAQGYMAMRFGPLSAEGGERRLNVLISRAKRRCEVFASITDEDFDLERAKGKGVIAFKLFLHYARTGRMALAQATTRGHDSLFEEQVAKALTKLGYQVHPQVGIAGFFIDLAVADQERPGRYVLGIECDGASYHSSRSARDRDRLRQAVLEDHGWVIHRIWSTDWFQRPKEQLDRVVAAIEAAKAELGERASRRATRAVPVEVVTIERADVTEVGLDAAPEPEASTAYIEASFLVPSGSHELHETPVHLLADIARRVVEVEGPVHLSEVTARIRTMWGLQRAGGRIQGAVERAVQSLVKSGQISNAGGFLMVPGGEVRVRDRAVVASGGLRQPGMLPPAEVEMAVRRVVADNLGASADEIVTGASRQFGFKSTSAQLREVIEDVVGSMVERAELVRNGEHYELASVPLTASTEPAAVVG